MARLDILVNVIDNTKADLDRIAQNIAGVASGAINPTTRTGRAQRPDVYFRGAVKAYEKQQRQLDKFNKAMRISQGQEEKESSTLDILGAAWHNVAAAIYVAKQAYQAIKGVYEFAEQGAQYERMIDTGYKVAKYYGTSMDEILEHAGRASMGTVSNYDMILGASQGMMFGVRGDAKQFGQLMEIAALRGRAFGLSTSKAFSDILRGIGRLSPLILDNIGITINAAQTYEDYAKKIGKASDALTPMEKRQALFNRVIEEGEIMLEQTGGLVWDNASAFEYLGASTANVFREVGAWAGKPIASIGTLSMLGGLGKEFMEKGAISKWQFVKDMQDAVLPGGREINQIAQEYLNLEKELSLEIIESTLNMSEKDRETTSANEELRNLMMTEDSYGRIIRMSGTEIENLISEKEDLSYAARMEAAQNEDLAKIYEDLNEALAEAEKAKKSERQGLITAAYKDLNETTEDMVMNMTKLAGATNKFQYELAYAFGEIDSKQLSAFLEIQDIIKSNLTGPQKRAMIMEIQMLLKIPDSTPEDIENVFGGEAPIYPTLDPASFSGVELDLAGLSRPRYVPIIPIMMSQDTVRSGGNVKGGGMYSRMLQHGGYAFRNTPYIVGEAGPELFVPNQSGTVVSADRTKNISGGGGTYHFYNKVTFVVEGGEVNMAKLMKQIGV